MRCALIAVLAMAPGPTLDAALDRVRPVAGEVIVRGRLSTALDGSEIDAVSQVDRGPFGGERGRGTAGLFDLAAGGLRVAAADRSAHEYRLSPSGQAAPGCAAAGVPAPCLVPRTAALAHERLVPSEAFLASLSGTLEVRQIGTPSSRLARAVAPWAAVVAGLGSTLAAIVLLVRARRARTRLGRVRAAAREARRAIARHATLSNAALLLDALVARARVLDHAAAEARRLGGDATAPTAELDRIEASLRDLALRAGRATPPRAAVDPVQTLLDEVAIGEAASAEAEALLPRRA